MSTVATEAPRPGRRPSSSRAEIVDCAIRMLDREGGEALSYRAVARELDVSVGALSRYFASLADLEDEVAAKLLSQLRPIESTGKTGLRQQLLRLSTDMLELNREHPYLLKLHGTATTIVVANLTRHCVKVMVDAGIDFDRGMAIFALISNMPYAWSLQSLPAHDPERAAEITQIYLEHMGEFGPQLTRMATRSSGASTYRRWLQLYLDALLP